MSMVHNRQINAEKREARSDIRATQKVATAHTSEAMGAAVADMNNLHNHRTGELDAYKAAETTRYEDLKDNQQGDRKRMQEAWGKLKARRTETIRGIKTAISQTKLKRQAHNQAFKEATKGEAEKKVRQRNRSKERKPRSRGRTQKHER